METSLEQLQYPIGRYVKPEQDTPELRNEYLDVLNVLPRWMDVCIENLDAAQLDTPYRPGGWTIKQVVHHLADSHMNAYIRLRLALTEDNPTVKPYSEQAWAELPDVHTVPVNVSVTMLHAMHRRLVSLLESLDDAGWQRTYYHPEHNRTFPVWELAATYAWHSRHHMEHIRQLRVRMGW